MAHDYAIAIHDTEHSQLIVGIGYDGAVTFGEGVTPDAAAQQFWDKLSAYVQNHPWPKPVGDYPASLPDAPPVVRGVETREAMKDEDLETRVDDGQLQACRPTGSTAAGNEASPAVFAFEVNVKGTDWTQIVNARTRGQAKVEYWRHVADAWPEIPFTAILCRKVGAPQSSEGFIRNAEYRGVPHVRCGQRVLVCGKARGVIVGHNSSANFDVLFDADSPLFPNVRGNVHPAECEFVGGSNGR